MERTHQKKTLDRYSKDYIYEDTNFINWISLPANTDNRNKKDNFGLSTTFKDCTFSEDVEINSDKNKHCVLTFIDCVFIKDILAEDAVRDGKVRFRNCHFKGNVNFRNTTFNNLADFWSCIFYKPTTFYKTDFLSTAVFSSVVFKENILFTYTLFEGKTIFGRTKIKKGIDISQSIIAGELQLFDLDFEFDSFKTEYVSLDDEKFQDNIGENHIIPLINKVATFQILKSQFDKQGNHIDEITMRQQEKKAFSELTQARKKDKNWTKTTGGDRFILWLNRWSNHHKADFRNGIIFTTIVALIFLTLTFLTTGEFWSRLCLDCEFDTSVIGYSIKSFVNFLNPVHKINYIDNLKPFFGIPYVFDFLGRLFVGYGIYQTVQAFRKFR